MRLISWNVNGLRACDKKGFPDFFAAQKPDVLCLQEVRAHVDQVPMTSREPAGYTAAWNAAEKKGYSGVTTWTNREGAARHGLGVEEFDGEGRVIVTELGDFALYNIYFPNGGRDLERVPFKLAFYEALIAQLRDRLAAGDQVVVCGDFNTARTAIDLANPKANEKLTGFLPVEREVLDRFFALGFVDVFRERHPDEKGHYTWWSNRPGVRERNVGWRIDYFAVSAGLAPRVKDARIMADVMGSDHCPVLIELG